MNANQTTLTVLSAAAWRLLALASATMLVAGCSRSLTISQTDTINNGMFGGAPEQRIKRSAPLEVTLVCVLPRDLDNEANDLLEPTSGITAADWYKRRPLPGDRIDLEEAHDRFRLPKKQIYLLTGEKEVYGTPIGSFLRGATQDGRVITKSGIEFDSMALHDNRSVIYVFPKFTGPDGKVLPVAPAIFHPPGAYERGLYVMIGADPARGNFGQYIEIDAEKCPRKLHGGGEAQQK